MMTEMNKPTINDYVTLRRTVDVLYDVQDVRIRTANRLRLMPKETKVHVAPLLNVEKNLTKEVEGLLSRIPIYTLWLGQVKGIGPRLGGSIIAQTMIRFEKVSGSEYKKLASHSRNETQNIPASQGADATQKPIASQQTHENQKEVASQQRNENQAESASHNEYETQIALAGQAERETQNTVASQINRETQKPAASQTDSETQLQAASQDASETQIARASQIQDETQKRIASQKTSETQLRDASHISNENQIPIASHEGSETQSDNASHSALETQRYYASHETNDTHQDFAFTQEQLELAQKTDKGDYLIPILRGIGAFDTVSKFWAWSGLHVIDGRSPKRSKGERINWNPKLRTLAWKIGKQFVRQGDYYRKMYDEYKERVSAARLPVGICPEYQECLAKMKKRKKPACLGHVEAMARRYAVKMFLSHLWEKWRRLEGLQVREPYAIDKLGHTTKSLRG